MPQTDLFAVPAIGHNGGPPLDPSDPNGFWWLYCWKKAPKRA